MSYLIQRDRPAAYKTIKYIFLLILLPAFFSCGYHLRPAGGSIGTNFESIAIPILSSPSSFVGVEGDLTRIIRDEFITHSKVELLSKDEAQGILYCQIHSIQTTPLTYSLSRQNIHGYDSTEKTTNSRTLKVTVGVKLEDRRTGKIIWRNQKLTEDAPFQIGKDPLSMLHNQRRAFISIAHSLAKRIYSNTMERF